MFSFNVELRKDDFVDLAKELLTDKKKLFSLIFHNYYLLLFTLLISIITSFFVSYITKLSFLFFIIYLISCFCSISLFLLNKKYLSRILFNYSLHDKNFKYELSCNNNNIIITSEKYIFSFFTNQIMKYYETENFYILCINSYVSTPFIFIKKNQLTENDNENIKYILTDRLNISQKIKNINLKYFDQAILIMLVLFVAFNWIYRYKPSNPIGITIDKIPVITLVEKGSIADKIGLSVGDQIIIINDNKVFNKKPSDISKIISKSKKVNIQVIKTKSNSLQSYEFEH